jgi:hypothetical protein
MYHGDWLPNTHSQSIYQRSIQMASCSYLTQSQIFSSQVIAVHRCIKQQQKC